MHMMIVLCSTEHRDHQGRIRVLFDDRKERPRDYIKRQFRSCAVLGRLRSFIIDFRSLPVVSNPSDLWWSPVSSLMDTRAGWDLRRFGGQVADNNEEGSVEVR